MCAAALARTLVVFVNTTCVLLPTVVPRRVPPDLLYGLDVSALCAAGTNVLHVRAKTREAALGDTRIAVHAVRPRAPAALAAAVPRLPADACRAHVRAFFAAAAADDVVLLQTRVSLRCPLSLARIRVPARARTCTHVQCFDLGAFLAVNAKTPKFLCPVCSRPAPFAALVVDTLFAAILAAVPSSRVLEVAIDPDGNWTPDSPVGDDSDSDDEGEGEAEHKDEAVQPVAVDPVPVPVSPPIPPERSVSAPTVLCVTPSPVPEPVPQMPQVPLQAPPASVIVIDDSDTE